MGRCSYTWKEWDEEENKFAKKYCQREMWKGSDEFCIFHDPSSEKDVDLFKKMIEEQIESETERYDFIGYCFPEKWDFFVDKKLEINANFMYATFCDAFFNGAVFKGKACFDYSHFMGDVDFTAVEFKEGASFSFAVFQKAYFRITGFKGHADFFSTTFKRYACFWGTNFENWASFISAKFEDGADFRDFTSQGMNFRGSIFEKKLELVPEGAGKIDLRDAGFLFRSRVTANLRETLYQGAFTENVAFIDCRWPKNYVIYEEKHMNDEEINLSFSQLETIYRDLKQNMQNHGDYVKAGEFYYREMEMRRKGASKREHLWLSLYKAIAGYGERPQNTALVSGSIVFLFALLYAVLNCLHYSVENPSLQQKIIDVIYFSFVTFTTLGLGDIAPATTVGKALICFEAVIGAFMIAVFVVVFVRKMAR